jgi:hypothetical protein
MTLLPDTYVLVALSPIVRNGDTVMVVGSILYSWGYPIKKPGLCEEPGFMTIEQSGY